MGRLPIPYHGEIGHRLRHGEIILINGFIPADLDRFTVNFHVHDHIAFTFDVRFHDEVIVRNTLVDGEWGEEEREGGFPFKHNHYFDIAILCKDSKFKLSVCGKGTFNYGHRMDMNDITAISITCEGPEVFVNNISFKLPAENGVQTNVVIAGTTKLPKKYAKFRADYESQSSSEDSD